MDDHAFNALLAANMGSMFAALQSWRILANNGLLDPKDLDGMVHGLTLALERQGDNPIAAEILSAVQTMLDARMGDLYFVAQTQWKGPETPA